MSQTRLCRDSSWGNDRNGSKLMNAKGQISLSQGLIHKNGKPSLSLKLSENPYLNKKQHVWLVNGDAKQVNSVNASNSLVWDSDCLEMSTYGGTETVSPSRKKALPMAEYCLSEAEGLNYPLLRDMSNSNCIDADGLSGAYPTVDLDSGVLSLVSETAADKNKTADKKSKGKRKRNVNKKPTVGPASEKDSNCNTSVISKIQSNTTTDAGRNQWSQTEGMGKELEHAISMSAESQDSVQKATSRKKVSKDPIIVYAEDIPDYRGKEKIEDLLNFIGKSPSNDTLSKDKKKKSKKKSLHGRPCRSSVENKDEKTELLDSESTDLYPAKSSSLDKVCCNCNNSEIDSCLGDDNGQADDSVVLNPEYSSPNSAEPFILVEKKSKKRLNPNLNRPNKFAPKSPYRNRKLSSSVMHPHQPQHFHCNEKAELDSSYPDLDSSYCKARRNSTGNVHMQMSAVQSITMEDSDNESWTSLPISQGIQLINENSYPISYAKIAALSLSSSNSQSLNRSVPCSASKTGENVPGCKETSAVVKINSVSVIKDNQVRRTSNSNEQSCCGSDISTENSDNSANYLLKDNNSYLDRRHSVGECIANGTSMKEPKVTTSTPKKPHDKGQKDKAETKEQDISFCDHKTSSIYKNIVSGLCLSSTENGEENFNLSLNNLNKAKNFNKSKLVSHHPLVQQQQQQQCNIYVNNSNAKYNIADILAVKFINPRDKKHNDKQYKITFGFFYDPDNKNGRNMTRSDTTIDSSSSCPLSSELPTSSPAEPFLPKQVSNDKDEDHKKLEDKAISNAKLRCKESSGGVLKSSHNKINPGDEVTGKRPQQFLEENCDSSEKTVKTTEAVKCVSKLNGVVLPNNKNSLETYSFRTNAKPESATISTCSTTPSTTSNPKTVSPTAVDGERPRGLSNIQGNSNHHHHHHHHNHNPSNNKTIPDTNCGDSTVRSLQDSLQFIPLSYGDKIQKDNKQKVIHFRSDVADTQLFNQQEILSYLSNEYHRVCHLSGPSAIVRVGND